LHFDSHLLDNGPKRDPKILDNRRQRGISLSTCLEMTSTSRSLTMDLNEILATVDNGPERDILIRTRLEMDLNETF
jgi:hypothetical protein